jgi:anthranilate phosphoribosyltransferase
MIRDSIEAVVNGSSLTVEEAADAMTAIMTGEATPAQFGAFVTALRLKGETAQEIAGMARVMREMSLHVEFDGDLVDTCGTGGDGSGSFNVSTAAAFVAAGAGATVAKHGNRAMSGATGSADVLETLGVRIDLGPEGVKRCLEQVGFGFMFAQRYHPSMRFAAGPRREIGIRTVFNILGPLTNPANARRQVIGVADTGIGERMAQVLGMLGTERALVVHGNDGMDEITVTDASGIWDVKGGTVSTYQVTPEEVGLSRGPADALGASSKEQSAETVRAVLGGRPGPARDIVLMNAAAALVAAGKAASLEAGVRMAEGSIDGGAAARKLDDLVALSQQLE